jgi:hypothetical protein
MFVCACRPSRYAVTGRPDADLTAPAIVVLQDIFETFEKPRIFLHKLLRKHVGTQALFFNFPGQAYAEPGNINGKGGGGGNNNNNNNSNHAKSTASSPSNGGDHFGGAAALNNVYLAALLDELLQKLERDGEFVTSCRPFYLVGFGNGGNVATYFASTHGRRQAE